nr:MAG TPA: hypothetical protein [Caudoviricetes sp.]
MTFLLLPDFSIYILKFFVNISRVFKIAPLLLSKIIRCRRKFVKIF